MFSRDYSRHEERLWLNLSAIKKLSREFLRWKKGWGWTNLPGKSSQEGYD
jgi:hypothetical protein